MVIAFVVIALVAAYLGFGLLAGVAGLIAKILFFVFLVLIVIWVIRLLVGGGRGHII